MALHARKGAFAGSGKGGDFGRAVKQHKMSFALVAQGFCHLGQGGGRELLNHGLGSFHGAALLFVEVGEVGQFGGLIRSQSIGD